MKYRNFCHFTLPPQGKCALSHTYAYLRDTICECVISKLHGLGLTVSLLLRNIEQLDSLYKEYENPLKPSPTYYYLAPSLDYLLCCHKTSYLEFFYCSFGAITVKKHLSNHLNTGLVWFLNGKFVSGCQWVWYLKNALKTGLKKSLLMVQNVQYLISQPSHHLNTGHLYCPLFS